MYQLAFFTGFGVSCVVYLLLNWIWPARGVKEYCQTFEEVDLTGWEHGGRPENMMRREGSVGGNGSGSAEDDAWDAEEDDKKEGGKAYVSAAAA